MSFLRDFIRQNVPKAGKDMPVYYQKVLVVCNALLAVYFPLFFLLLGLLADRWSPVPLILGAVVTASSLNVHRMGMRSNLLIYGAVTVAWCAWFNYMFGWGCGAQHLLMPLLILVFFAIYIKPQTKICLFAGLVIFRMGLYYYTEVNAPVCELSRTAAMLAQTLNSVTTFIMMACACILFSTNTQATERQLRIVNQTLHREAGTDPLTQLPNRRAMLDEINLFLEKTPNEAFCVAIADIDFFKRVNDTYGHHCGDYTLKQLADLFRESAGARYQVCRWGGEEFFFFMPGLNLDEAAKHMYDLNTAVRKMPLSYEGNDFNITITIGVAENDFQSPMQVILDEADQKLYMGKSNGRNQVVA